MSKIINRKPKVKIACTKEEEFKSAKIACTKAEACTKAVCTKAVGTVVYGIPRHAPVKPNSGKNQPNIMKICPHG